MVKENTMNWSEAEIHSTDKNNKQPRMNQTEIGLLPEDWAVKTVEEGFDICNNLRLPISDDIRKSMLGDYPYYGPTKVQDYINEYRVDGEYSLIGEDGDHFLKWVVIPMTQYVHGKFNVNNHAHLIKGKPKTTITKWFYFYFKHRDLTNFLTRQGASRYKLSKSTLVKIPFALPPLPEQEAIAEALSDADAWIENLQQLIAKKRLIKQGAMQELLSPKKDWEVKKLGEVATISGGGTPSTFVSEYWNGDIEWFTPTEVGYDKYLYSSKRKITNTGLKNSSATILPINTILLTSRAGIGDLGILKIEASTNQGFQSIICKEMIDVEFIYYLMSTKKEELLKNASGSTFLEISPNKVKSLEIIVPDLTEQTRIATILSDMDEELEALEAQLSKAKKVKQGMMQELLTGRTRLI